MMVNFFPFSLAHPVNKSWLLFIEQKLPGKIPQLELLTSNKIDFTGLIFKQQKSENSSYYLRRLEDCDMW